MQDIKLKNEIKLNRKKHYKNLKIFLILGIPMFLFMFWSTIKVNQGFNLKEILEMLCLNFNINKYIILSYEIILAISMVFVYSSFLDYNSLENYKFYNTKKWKTHTNVFF